MNWAFLGLGVFVVIVLSWNVAHLSVTISKIVQGAQASMIAYTERASRDRQADRELIKSLTDRLIAQDWESVRLHEGASMTPDGAFLSPSDQQAEVKREMEETIEPLVEQLRPRWGHASAMTDFFERQPDPAEALAAEDELDLLPEERSR